MLFAYQFGSSAESDSFRDLDIGIYLQGEKDGDSFDRTMKMSADLERQTGIRTDVILINTAPDHLIHSVSNGIILVNRDDDVRVRFLTRSWSRYFDIAVKRQAYLRAVAEVGGTHDES